MKAQKTELSKQLLKHGWNVSEVINPELEWDNLEWWEDEIWILESIWSAKSPKVYLTFIVNPQSPIHGRKKDEGIWAAKASLERLEDWKSQEGVIFLGLGKGWEKDLPDFLKGVDELRNRKKEKIVS
jgi:hypothetical protein